LIPKPAGPSRTESTSGVTISKVRAFTTASDGSIYQPVYKYVLCFTDEILIQNHPAINKVTGCADSTAYDVLDRGTVDISVTVDGTTTPLGFAPGDLSQQLRFLNVPEASTVTVTATPNGDCTFWRWKNVNRSGTSYTSYTPTLVHQASSSDQDYFAYFICPV